MNINIKYDINEIAESIKAECTEYVRDIARREFMDLVAHVRGLIDEQAKALAETLEIKDERKRERVKRALNSSLNKWITGALK